MGIDIGQIASRKQDIENGTAIIANRAAPASGTIVMNGKHWRTAHVVCSSPASGSAIAALIDKDGTTVLHDNYQKLSVAAAGVVTDGSLAVRLPPGYGVRVTLAGGATIVKWTDVDEVS